MYTEVRTSLILHCMADCNKPYVPSDDRQRTLTADSILSVRGVYRTHTHLKWAELLSP